MRHPTTIFVLFFLAPVVTGQTYQPDSAPREPATLLYVRCSGPTGMHVAFFRGRPAGIDFEAPVQVGLRPGYAYRVRLSGLTNHSGLSLQPTLEVHDSLRLPRRGMAADFPVAVDFTDADIERVLAGERVTKAYFADIHDSGNSGDTLLDCRNQVKCPRNSTSSPEQGCLLLVVRLGERNASNEELAGQSIPGTILLPGERALPPVRYGPTLPPPDGSAAKFTQQMNQVEGVHTQQRLAGASAVQETEGVAGSRSVDKKETRIGPSSVQMTQGQGRLQVHIASELTQQTEQIGGVHGQQRPAGTVATRGTEGVGGSQRLQTQQVQIGSDSLQKSQSPGQLDSRQSSQMTEQAQQLGSVHGRKGLAGTEAAQSTDDVAGVHRLETQEQRVSPDSMQMTRGHAQIEAQAASRCTQQAQQPGGVFNQQRPAGTQAVRETEGLAVAQRPDTQEARISSDLVQSLQGHQQIDKSVSSQSTEQVEHLGGTHAQQRPAGTSATRQPEHVRRVETVGDQQAVVSPGAIEVTAQSRKLEGNKGPQSYEQLAHPHEFAGPAGIRGVQQTEDPRFIRRVEETANTSKMAGPADAQHLAQPGSVTWTTQDRANEFAWSDSSFILHPSSFIHDSLALSRKIEKMAAPNSDVFVVFVTYINRGQQTVSEAAVMDTLEGGLELIPGSMRSDRGASFETRVGPGGSLILRWNIQGQLTPGESGVVWYQALEPMR